MLSGSHVTERSRQKVRLKKHFRNVFLLEQRSPSLIFMSPSQSLSSCSGEALLNDGLPVTCFQNALR